MSHVEVPTARRGRGKGKVAVGRRGLQSIMVDKGVGRAPAQGGDSKSSTDRGAGKASGQGMVTLHPCRMCVLKKRTCSFSGLGVRQCTSCVEGHWKCTFVQGGGQGESTNLLPVRSRLTAFLDGDAGSTIFDVKTARPAGKRKAAAR